MVVPPPNTSIKLIRFCELFLMGIKFVYKLTTLILWSFLPLSWETMVSSINNYFGKKKLNYDDMKDLI